MKRLSTASAFQDRLGYRFRDQNLLVEALSHTSQKSLRGFDNQRLEFLGDRVLGIVIAEELLKVDPDARPGDLAVRYNYLVSGPTCAEMAESVNLGAVIILGNAERKSGGRRNPAILADAMEAVIAAIFIDGGMEPAKSVILNLWRCKIESLDGDVSVKDPKSTLQEWVQARGQNIPRYSVLDRSGEDHLPRFTVQVEIDTGAREIASGTTKRGAEGLAATALLARLHERND